MLDGSHETFQRQDGGGINAFMRVSVEEEGLLSPSQAAHVLSVSPERINQLVRSGVLNRWEFFGKPYVSAAEVLARRKADIKNGRPARSVAGRLKVAAKVAMSNDAAQWLTEAVI
jgi:hypothetical protein